MIIVYAKCIVSSQKKAEFLELAEKLVEATRQESGNISYELIHSLTGPSTYAFLERWENNEVLNCHLHAKAFIEIMPQLRRLMVADIDIVTHELLI